MLVGELAAVLGRWVVVGPEVAGGSGDPGRSDASDHGCSGGKGSGKALGGGVRVWYGCLVLREGERKTTVCLGVNK